MAGNIRGLIGVCRGWRLPLTSLAVCFLSCVPVFAQCPASGGAGGAGGGRVGGPRAGGQGGFGQAMQMMQMLQFAQQMQRRQMPFQGGRQPFGFAGTPTTPDRNSNLLSLNRTFTEAVSLPGTTQTSSAPAPEPPTMTRQERLREAIRQKRLEREARREEARQAPRRRSRQLIFMPTTVRGNASRR